MRIENLPVHFTFTQEECESVLSETTEQGQLQALTELINKTLPTMDTANRYQLKLFKQYMGEHLVGELETKLKDVPF